MTAQLAAARADFRACRHTQLAHRLPHLLARATAGRDQAALGRQAGSASHLAQAYGIATQLLIKLHDGLASMTADRAVQAARAAADPLVDAQATRLVATVLRRADHRDGAQSLVLHAAEQLDARTGLADPGHNAMYAQLLAASAPAVERPSPRST
jgi:hypothetical protein